MSPEPEEGDASEVEQSLAVPLVWVASEEPVVLANQCLVQEHQGTFFITIGQVAPPPLLGTPEEQIEQARGIAFVDVKTVGRFSMNRRTLEELVGVLTLVASRYDERESKGQQ